MKKAVHAIRLMRMTNDTWRCYGFTLCGHPGATVGVAGSTADPDGVTCKSCRGARGWPFFFSESVEHKAKGRLPVTIPPTGKGET